MSQFKPSQPQYTNPPYPPSQPLPPGPQKPPARSPQPQAKPPKRDPRKVLLLLIVAIAVLGALIGGIAGFTHQTNTAQSTPTAQATTQPTSVPTQVAQPTHAPTHVPQSKTIQTFSGHLSGGNWYDTPYFSVPDNWQVSWTCTNGDSSLPIVTIVGYDHSGNPLPGDDDIAAHGNCADLAGIGPIQSHGGTIHLHIYAQGDWTVSVSVMQ